MKRSVALAALTSAALVSGVAFATMQKSGTATKIAVSGKGGAESFSFHGGNPLIRLRFAESADLPNSVWITAFDTAVAEADFEEKKWGDGSDSSRKTLEVAYGHDTKRAFHGLQVCMNGDKTRIKGVRAFASEFVWEGSIAKAQKRAALKQEFVRPNCDEKDGWMPARHCPDGQVMVGVGIEYNETPHKVITGLAPICQTVTLRKVTTGQ